MPVPPPSRLSRFSTTSRWLSLALAIGVPWAGPAKAQDASMAVTGTVVDARTGDPIEAAVVVLEPVPGGAVGPDPASGRIRLGLTATTGAGGAYGFRGLPAGAYRLRVSRYAYEPATVDIEVGRAAGSVSIALVVDPVAMEPVEVSVRGVVEAGPAAAFDRDVDARADLERERQERWLPSDVRALTRHDVVEGVTLAESDLFRALLRLPGVTTRDDYTAELWTRGAPWSHTRVTFDGLPLFNPLHGVGVFGGVNPDAVGAAFFFPGGRPARIGGGAAAVVELASRPATPDEELGGAAEISLVSARATLHRGASRGGWMVAGRRSWLDLVTWAIEAAGGGEDVHVPYAFHDLTGRADLDLGGGRVLEASGLWVGDVVRDDVPDVAEVGPSRWGNALGRLTLETPVGGARARHTIGLTRFSAEGLRETADDEDELFDIPGIRTDHELLHWTVTSELAPAAPDAASRWSLGGAVIGQWQRYRGPAPTPHPGPTTFDSLATRQRLTHLALWGERRLSPASSLSLDVGARLEAGDEIAGAPSLRLAPRLAARWSSPGRRSTISVAWTRAWQYAQAVAPAGLPVGPRLHPNDLWFLAGDAAPALRTDVATAGVEAWVGGAWLVSITGWLRRTDGVALPDPRPGPIVDPEPFHVGTGRARGMDLSLRRLFGRWTAALGYAWTRSRSRALDRGFSGSHERRHAVDAVGAVRVGRAWRLGAAYRWASGAPFTRFFPATIACSEVECRIVEPARVEEPNAERGPTWSTLDLAVEWTRERESWSLSVFGQVSNALNRDNALTYRGTEEGDEFERGLPILPVVGARMAF